MGGKKIRSDTERALQDYAALPYLQTLVDSGCDRNEIISYMQLAFLADDSWETLVNMNLKAFKGLIKQIRDCADIIDRMNRTELIYHLAIETRDARFVGLHESPTLAERVRDYASKLDSLRGVFGPDRNLRRHAWKALVVANVIEDTMKPHDLEVSSLIAAVLDDPRYSPDAHKAWRLKHMPLIEGMRKTLQDRRLKRALLSAPWLSNRSRA
jgi:hypothetical protein